MIVENEYGSSRFIVKRQLYTLFFIVSLTPIPFINVRTNALITYNLPSSPNPTGTTNSSNIFPRFSIISKMVLYTDSASENSTVGGKLFNTLINSSRLGESITFFNIRFIAEVAKSTAFPHYRIIPFHKTYISLSPLHGFHNVTDQFVNGVTYVLHITAVLHPYIGEHLANPSNAPTGLASALFIGILEGKHQHLQKIVDDKRGLFLKHFKHNRR